MERRTFFGSLCGLMAGMVWWRSAKAKSQPNMPTATGMVFLRVPRAWSPTWNLIDEFAIPGDRVPSFGVDHLVILANGTATYARLVDYEATEDPKRFRYIWEKNGARLINRVIYWSEFRQGWGGVLPENLVPEYQKLTTA